MGEALLGRLCSAAGWRARRRHRLWSSAVEARRTELGQTFRDRRAPTNPAPADGAVLAVKPADVDAACAGRRRAGAAPGAVHRRRRSPSPGSRRSGPRRRLPVVRAMPNTPALVGAGRRPSPPGGGRRGRPGLGRGDPRRRRHGGAGRRGAARRRHRAVGIGPRLRVPRGRGADRGGRARRAARRRRGRRWPSRRCSASARLLAESGDGSRGAAGRGHLAGRHHRGRAARARARPAVRGRFLDAVGRGHRAQPANWAGAEHRRPPATAGHHSPHQPRSATVPASGGRGLPHGADPAARPQFLTVHEVADLLRVSSMTVYRLIKSGSCAPSGSASRTGCARTTSTPTWPAGSPRPAERRGRRGRRQRTSVDVAADVAPWPALRHDLLPVRLRHCRRVRRRGQVGDPLDRARRRPWSTSPTTSRPTTSAPARSPWPAASSTSCPGVVLAVVDPGVGTDRRAVAIEVGDGESYLVGPDNGLLAPAVAMVGGATAAVELDQPRVPAPAPGPDLRRPRRVRPGRRPPVPGVAARRARATGRPGHAAARRRCPLTRDEDGDLVGRGPVGRPLRQLPSSTSTPTRSTAGATASSCGSAAPRVRTARRVTAYDDLRTGQVGLVVDYYGLLSIAVRRGSAAADLGRRRVGRRAATGPRVDEDAGAIGIDSRRRASDDPRCDLTQSPSTRRRCRR